MRERTLNEITRLCGFGICRQGQGRSASGAQFDSRLIVAGDLFFPLPGTTCHGIDFVQEAFDRGAVAAVCEPDQSNLFDGPAIVVDDTLKALGRLAAAIRQQERHEIPAIAITGSYGKTTTCQFVGELLGKVMPTATPEASHNNHLGVPLTILNAPESSKALVCEVGSNTPGEIEPLGRWIAPRSALVTSIGPAHLAGFGDLAGVAREKFSLFKTIEDGGIAWLPVEVRGHPLAPEVETCSFGVGGDLELVRTGDCKWHLEDRRRHRRIPFTWRPPTRWASRCLEAALAISLEVVDGVEEMLSVAEGLSLPPLRGQVISAAGVDLVLDCYNSSPGTLEAAVDDLLEHSPGRRLAVVGTMEELGKDEHRWHFEAGEKLAASDLDRIFLHGRGGSWLLEGIESAGGRGELLDGDEVLASAAITDRLETGDRVLFKASRSAELERLAEGVASALREKVS